jgi:hypothetical protein
MFALNCLEYNDLPAWRFSLAEYWAYLGLVVDELADEWAKFHFQWRP